MDDKELLRRAAMAVGFDLDEDGDRIDEREASGAPKPWNPLEDDGDAFRLMVKALLDIEHYPNSMEGELRPWVRAHSLSDDVSVGEDYAADPLAATRRAIVKAVAEKLDQQPYARQRASFSPRTTE